MKIKHEFCKKLCKKVELQLFFHAQNHVQEKTTSTNIKGSQPHFKSSPRNHFTQSFGSFHKKF